jgi:hypothetical protein
VTIELGETVIPDEEHNGYNGPSALTVADFNNDGKPDMALANPEASNVSILLNQWGAASNAGDPPPDDGDDSTQSTVLFSDDFNDNQIDGTKWTYGGNTVTETGGIMQVETTVTDQGGWLLSPPIPIGGTGTVEISRRARLHYANQYSGPGLSVYAYADDSPVTTFGLQSTQTAELYGDAGNDRITAGRAHDIVLGDDGNDTLTAGSGDDLLVGGPGRDRLVGGIGDDLLVAGSLVEPDDPCEPLDLGELLGAWRSDPDTDSREAFADYLVDLVLDDGERDLITGGFGADLFTAGLLDRIIVRKPDDFVRLSA